MCVFNSLKTIESEETHFQLSFGPLQSSSKILNIFQTKNRFRKMFCLKLFVCFHRAFLQLERSTYMKLVLFTTIYLLQTVLNGYLPRIVLYEMLK